MADPSDVIRAPSDSKFYLRFLLIGLGALGFATYCLYDGFIGYPKHNEKVAAYERFIEEEDRAGWDEFAREQGWSVKNPGEHKGPAKIVSQFVMAGVCGLVGLPMLIGVARSRGRWIEATHDRLKTSWGAEFAFDQVVAIDKRKWANKGIAKIKYNDGGRARSFTLDDFKFAREQTDEILYRIEQKAGADKILNGPPEGPPGEPAAVASEPS